MVGFLQGFERFRNRLSLVDHQAVSAAQTAGPGRTSCASRPCRGRWPATLRISIGEAGRRVRAAEAWLSGSAMSGEPLGPVRPHLAAAQRDGDVVPEQVDIVERALAKVDRVGFDPETVDSG